MHTTLYPLSAAIRAAAAVGGSKETAGPLGAAILADPQNDDRFGTPTWEQAEAELQRRALNAALTRADFSPDDLDLILGGDLLNQCTASAYGLLEFAVPYLGLYGACSTCAEGLFLAAMATSGHAEAAAVVTSSHYAAAERQYRFPLEYGGQRPPTAQWTVTGSGAFIVTPAKAAPAGAPRIVDAMPGRVVEMGVTDANNMGAAMAPAAIDTLTRYFTATHTTAADYDLILTGDLGREGSALLCELMEAESLPIADRHRDCGLLIYDCRADDRHAGGSGCGCSAVVLAAHILPRLERGDLRNILFLATGAMMSPDSVKQGLAIPAIAHLIHLRGGNTK